MTTTRFDAKARTLARETGLDRLGQAKLQKLDANGDGVVTLTDVRRLTKAAGLEKDQSLSREDRKRIDQALGGAPSTSTTATSGPSSVVSTMTGGKKTLADTYIDARVQQTAKGLSISVDGGLWNGGKHVGDKSRALVLPGFETSAVDLLFYGPKGQTGLPNSSGTGSGVQMTCFAAGMLIAAADEARGLVVVDVAARDFLDGKQPPHRRLLSPAEIVKAPAVKAFAKQAGLDTKSLTVTIKEVWLSAAFEDPKLNTIAFEAKLTDKSGKSKTQKFSTYLSGDLSKSAEKLSLDALETGLASSWGYLMPPSAAKPKKATGADEHVSGGGGGIGGGGEHSHVHGTGGGEHGGYAPSAGGGE